jgi:peptidoglycan/LPS O-acetylase OafA/YrhL
LPGYLSNSVGAWSLGIELLFYLIFPVLCLMTRTMPGRRLAGAVLVSILAQQMLLALLHRLASSDPERFWDYYSTPLTFLPFFLIGLWIARASTVRREFYLLPTIVALGAIIVFSLLDRTHLFTNPAAYLLLTALASIAVLSAYCSTLPRSLAGFSAFLGNISYALYLTHPFSLRLAQAATAQLGGSIAAAGFVFFPVSLVIAYLTFALFERPVRDYLRGLQSREWPAALPTATDGPSPTEASK